jgi:hypothetical protein
VDTEIEAMSHIAKALEPLDQDAVRRVLKWAIERYQPRHIPSTGPAEAAVVPKDGAVAPARTFLNLSELFDAANAESGLDKVMVVAYWYQVLQNKEEWDSQMVNTELKHLGYPSTNITRDLDNLSARSPKLAMQVRKQGTTKQARKLYKLTREGIRAVEALLRQTAPLGDR